MRRIDRSAIPQPVLSLCETLRARGHRAWVVGGCVRDYLLGRAVADWDLCTTAQPDAVMKLFRKTVATGLAHGTVTVVLDREHYEVTTLRGEGAYTDGRRPDHVVYLDDIAADLERRDFTVNAIAYDPLEDAVEDPFGGQRDLSAGMLRAVGDPRARFREDGLRILRGCRFVSALGFSLEPATEAAMGEALDVFARVSPERVRDEWLKTLKTPAPSRAFEVMRRVGVLARVLPEATRVEASRYAAALAAVDRLAPDPVLRLAALLRPYLVEAPDPRQATEQWMDAWRFSRDERARVLRLVQSPLVSTWPAGDAPTLRRRVRALGLDALDDATALAAALDPAGAASVREAVDGALGTRPALNTRDLAVDGAGLQRHLGLGPSKRLGTLLGMLLEDVLDTPALNTEAALLARARAHLDAMPT
ncbi:MAG: hypothetical protein JNK72_12700 [Myxococcales bacterium]|nr:hypothetical protein [Myxococcales bacterium]